MKRPGPPCSVCAHERIAEIDASKATTRAFAKRFGLAFSSLQRHRKHSVAAEPARKTEPPPPPTSEREAILDTLARLKASLGKAETDDLPRIANAITAMGKRLAQLDEGREVTEEDIVRAPAFRSILARFAEALRPYPDAARAMLQAIGAA